MARRHGRLHGRSIRQGANTLHFGGRMWEAIKAVCYLATLPASEWDLSDGTPCSDVDKEEL